jgi:carbon starvation protein
MAFGASSAKLEVAVFLVHPGWNNKMKNNNSLLRHLPWLVLAIVGACALGVVALRRGEAINALWIVVAAVAIYLVAYRYYSLFIANKVMQLDPRRATPAVLNNDGLDYVPTNKHILSVTTSRPSPAQVRWSARCWRRKWATCPARCG